MPVGLDRLADRLDAAREAERVGAWDEALALYEDAFACLPSEGDAGTAAELLRLIGRIHRERGEIELALEAFEASLAIAEASGLREQIAAALNSMAVVEHRRGRLDVAEPLYARARVLAEEVGDERLAAMVDQNMGAVANIRGNLATALVSYRSALERYERLGDDVTASRALNNMGMAHVDLEEWEAAERCFDRAFALAEQAGDAALEGTVELNRAELYLKSDRFERARLSCDRAFAIMSRAEFKAGVAEAYKFYGMLYRETAKQHLAEIHLALALGLAQSGQNPLLEAETQSEWALVHLGAGRNREAIKCLNYAHRIFSELKARREVLDIERRLDRLKDAYLGVVQSWGSEAIESKDRYTAGHSQRVADSTMKLARAIGFTGWDLTWMRVGAFLHDVGKTVVPAEVLNKPGPLTSEEWELMRRHTVVGDAIVSELDFPWDIRPMVRNHHEHWDGSGYPDGLRGEDIPLTARILRISDVYDALTTARSYRPPFSAEEAMGIMERHAGRTVDPDLFAIFRGLRENEGVPSEGARRMIAV